VLCCAVLFLKLLQLWDRNGKLIKSMASLPLAEDIPIAFNSCKTGTLASAVLRKLCIFRQKQQYQLVIEMFHQTGCIKH